MFFCVLFNLEARKSVQGEGVEDGGVKGGNMESGGVKDCHQTLTLTLTLALTIVTNLVPNKVSC